MELADFSRFFPSNLVELGLGSLGNINSIDARHRNLIFTDFNIEYSIDDDEPSVLANLNSISDEPIHLDPIYDKTTVIALDTSCIVFGETKDGILCAIRGCIVWKENGAYQYIRQGPFLYHVTIDNHQWLYNKLRRIYFNSHEKVRAPSFWDMPGRIRNFLERWLQRQVCLLSENALILWDGSLTARTIDSPIPVVNDLLHAAQDRGNLVLAFSKKTRLWLAGRRVIDLIGDNYAPALLKIDEAIRSQFEGQLRFLGQIYAVKLAPGCYTFRLDIDRRIPDEACIMAVRRLIGNDLITESYPETLKLAHIFSRFTANEVIAMQRYVSDNFGLRMIHRPNVRQVLFGPLAGLNAKIQGESYVVPV